MNNIESSLASESTASKRLKFGDSTTKLPSYRLRCANRLANLLEDTSDTQVGMLLTVTRLALAAVQASNS